MARTLAGQVAPVATADIGRWRHLLAEGATVVAWASDGERRESRPVAP
jgi:hypothetical protein